MLDKNLLRKNDSGRSIVEMLGVLAIMGVITVMGIQGYSQAMGKMNRSKVTEQITEMAQEVRSLFATRQTYNENDDADGGYDIGNNLLRKMGMNMNAPYGGEYSVVSRGKAGGNPGFIITVPNIPTSDCLYFMTMTWNDVMDSNLQAPGSTAYFGVGSSLANATVADPVTGNSCSDTEPNVMSVYFK